jgi:rubrerythrin
MQDTETALAIVRRAVRNEIAGQGFYNDAAYHCIDLWAKEIFATLAREEEEHTRLLLLAYEALTRQGRWIDLDSARTSDAVVDITRLDFPEDGPAEELFPPEWSMGGVVDRRADDLAALAFGIQMEERTIDLYRRAATTSGDAAAQEAYEFLVQEEIRHYHQLKNHWEKLAGMAFEGT